MVETLIKILINEGFAINTIDDFVLNKAIDGAQTSIVIYVDDFLISSKNKEHVEAVRKLIKKRFDDYLGMLLKRKGGGSTMISMKEYIKSIIQKHPTKREYVVQSDDRLFHNEVQEDANEKPKLFHKIVAKLLYLSKRGQPDVSLPVMHLCTRVKEPTKADIRKLE